MGKITFKHYLRLLGIYAKMDLASLLRDTKYMLIVMFADFISNVASISGIFLLAWKFGGIGGLSEYEVLFMLAYGNIVMGVLNMSGGCNALYPSRIIGRGQWEHMFIMPLPYPVQLTVGVFPFTCSGELVSGIILMCFAVNGLEILPWWWIFSLLGNVLLSMVIVVALSYLTSSLAFYAPVQCEEISSTILRSTRHMSTFPLSGMPLYMKLPLLTILPAGLLAWLPTMLALGKVPAITNFFPLLFAALLSFAASHFFKKGLRYYVKTGINRYVAGGHRC